MLALVGALLSLGIGLAAGGRIDRLAGLRLTWIWVVPLALVAQAVVVYRPTSTNDALQAGLLIGSYLALLAVALRNLRLPGVAIVAVGVGLNLAVIAANGGMMPVAPETLQLAGRTQPWKVGDGSVGTHVARSKDVILRREDTWLEPLADRFWTGLPGRLDSIFSAGDVVLLAGLSFLIVRTLTTPVARPTDDSLIEEPHDPSSVPHVGVAV